MIRDFLIFLRRNMRWWLLPSILTLVVIVLVLLFSGSPAIAPFLYGR